jgi:FliI/YscN family ATPase
VSALATRAATARFGVPVQGGYVTALRGELVEACGLALPVGSLADIETGRVFLPAEVVAFRAGHIELMALDDLRGVAPGARVWPRTEIESVPAGDFLLGRIVGALCEPQDGGPPLPRTRGVPLHRPPLAPLARRALSEPLDVGVAAINALATVARGQRIGLFAGAGLGKSTLLGMIVRGTDADVRVIALIGERGREVRELVDHELGAARRTTVVVAVPADAAPLRKIRAAHTATAIAEHFRDAGRHVLLLMDSVTRFAMAARQVGLARGETTTARGYTPSVFAALPALIERAGCTDSGSITGVYNILVDGDATDDPIAESLRAILDGHIVLSRALAERGHFPAIDPLASVSRVMERVATPEHRQLATHARRLIAAHRDTEDLIQVGAYVAGSDALVDEAVGRRPAMEALLRQDPAIVRTLADAVAGLHAALNTPLRAGAPG